MSDHDAKADLHKRAVTLFAQDSAGIPSRPPSDGNADSGRRPSSSVGASTNWRTMQDVQARDEWIALRDWVEWVTVRYNIPITMVPTCWWRHHALVEELSALHCAHRAAFDPADTGNGPLIWHERFVAGQARLNRAYAGGCRDGHRSLAPRSWSNVTDEDEWTAWIEQSHAH